MRFPLLAAFALAATLATAETPEITFDLEPVAKSLPGRIDLPPDMDIVLNGEEATLTWTPEASGDERPAPRRYTLDVLASHPGPKGWSTHLAWMVARSRNDFWILWAYVNDAGSSCWINYYHFAENRIRMSLFRGRYIFRPPETFGNAPVEIDIAQDRLPAYAGKPFRHRDFGPAGGKFPVLRYLDGAEWKERKEELTVRPLIDVEVPAQNGWATDAWTEVHGLAWNQDATRLYYVVTYSAVNHGWVVDLRDGRVLKTHFGEKVVMEPK